MGLQAAHLTGQIDFCNRADLTFSAAHKPPPLARIYEKLTPLRKVAYEKCPPNQGEGGEGGEAKHGREHAVCGVSKTRQNPAHHKKKLR